MTDMPKEPPKQSEVRQAESADVSKFLDEWIKPAGKSGGKMSDTVSIGQIDELKLPSGWNEGQSVKPTGGASQFTEFHPDSHPDVQLYFNYRGRRVRDQAGDAFHKVLDKEMKAGEKRVKVSQDELAGLRDIIEEKSDGNRFKVQNAYVSDLNGKKVLIVEGEDPNTHLVSRNLYIDSDGSGTSIQEVTYRAPKEDYDRYLPTANSAISSIRWK